SSLREASRPTVRGSTVPGKRTVSRVGRMGSVSGMVGGRSSSGPILAGAGVSSGEAPESGAPGFAEINESEFIVRSGNLRRSGVGAQGEGDPEQSVAVFGVHARGIHFGGQIEHALEGTIINFHRQH